VADDRGQVVRAVGAPLGFFVLALLIVEAFLATVLVFADFTSTERVIGMWAGVGLFLIVTFIVGLLVWHKPQNLTFDREAHLIDSGKIPFGTESQTISPEDRFAKKREGQPGETK